MSCQTCNAGPMLGPQRVRSWLYQPTHVPLTPQESGNCKSKDLSHGENHSNSWSNTSNSSNLHLNSLIQKSPPKKLFNDLSFNSPILYIYICYPTSQDQKNPMAPRCRATVPEAGNPPRCSAAHICATIHQQPWQRRRRFVVLTTSGLVEPVERGQQHVDVSTWKKRWKSGECLEIHGDRSARTYNLD